VDYGCSHFLGGSGFVSVYVTGVFMANLHYHDEQINHQSIQEVLLPFNTMTEISIFLLFGLLVNPADLVPSLRGAVPLALSFNVANAIPNLKGLDPDLAIQLAQNCQSIVFIAVILNLLLQGLTLPPICRWLNGPPRPEWSS
jgi:potassium/hydrogen antiporter